MTDLNISPQFTIEDIRKVRDRDYELTKNMTTEEMTAYYDKGAERALREIAEIKAQKRMQKPAMA